MKKLKKIASVALALVMAMALMVPAMAAEPTGTITINRPTGMQDSQTAKYKVYRVFAMTKAANATDTTGYSYTATKNVKEAIAAEDSTVKDLFTFTAIPGSENFIVTPTDSYKTTEAAETFAAWLKDHTSVLEHTATANLQANAANVEVANAPYGYYFIDSNVGTLLQLDSFAPNVTVTDKNKAPTMPKTEDNADGLKKIGDTVNFTLPIDAKEGAENYVVYDRLGKGLTLNQTVKVQKNGTDVNAGAGTYTVAYATTQAPITYTKDNKTFNADFSVTFADAFLADLVDTDTVTVVYSAVINDQATTESIGNSATMKYGDNQWTSDSTTHGGDDNKDTMGTITINKYVGNPSNANDKTGAKLAGATFQLLDSNKAEIKVKAVMKTVEVEDPENPGNMIEQSVVDYYVPDTNGTASIVTDANGAAKIDGLGAGTYYLHETVAPVGYNLAANDAEVELTYNGQTFTVSTQTSDIANYTGAELPSTGGMGTTLFYAIGGVLLAGSAILFVTKKRMGE